MLSQFRARYCGHTLSRLAEIRHNRTKQSRFPTTRRKSLKSRMAMNTISSHSGLVVLDFFHVGVHSEQALLVEWRCVLCL